MNFERQFPIATSTPVTSSIILNWFQLDAGSLTQAKRKEKALKRIQQKMMCARSTLDWSQSNNISCELYADIEIIHLSIPIIHAHFRTISMLCLDIIFRKTIFRP